MVDAVAQDVFKSSKHETYITGTEEITCTAKWPLFTPQTSKRIYADMELFKQIEEHDLWTDISNCGQCNLFRRGDVMKTGGKYFLMLGDVQWTMLLA